MKNKPVEFVTLAEVIEIHRNQVALYGGDPGIRDPGLLGSALAVPQGTFEGRYLCKDHFEMAAAYAYHICQNHPFVDGNKRAALVTALVFLEFNGVRIDDPRGMLYDLMMGVACGTTGKKDIEDMFRKLARKGER